MEIKHGLISCDDHCQLDADNWTSRMSKAKWGDAIPQLWPTSDPAHFAIDWGEEDVWRWFINGKMIGNRGVSNCATVMIDDKWGEAGKLRMYFPQRWSDVPDYVYKPIERLKALDYDGIDASVLFFNDPVQGGKCFEHTPEFELEVAAAYNDGVAEWVKASDRYIALTMLPYLSGIENTVAEVERATKMGHKGINMEAEPSTSHKSLPHFNDLYWDPLWSACQEMGVAVHWHAGAGVGLEMERWKGYNFNEAGAMGRPSGFSTPAQYIPNALFSGVMERYPDLLWVTAEAGLGWVNYVLEGCDHEWERRKLWTSGLMRRPSDVFKKQMAVAFWHEAAGIEQRHEIGLDNIVWEADYPHPTATYPDSWAYVDMCLSGVPKAEKNKLLYENACRIYGFKV